MDPSDAHMKGKWMWEQRRQPSILPELVKSRRATGLPGAASGKGPACQRRRQEIRVRSLGWEDPLEKEMATHSSILDWRIPWMEEPGGLQSVGPQRAGHD